MTDKIQQVGQINNLTIDEINEKFRTVQRLFNEVFEITGSTFIDTDIKENLGGRITLHTGYLETYNHWGY